MDAATDVDLCSKSDSAGLIACGEVICTIAKESVGNRVEAEPESVRRCIEHLVADNITMAIDSSTEEADAVQPTAPDSLLGTQPTGTSCRNKWTEATIDAARDPDLAGWTVRTARTKRGQLYHVYISPGGEHREYSRIAALRCATGTLVKSRAATGSIGKYPNKRKIASRAARDGKEQTGDGRPIYSLDPRRAYFGPKVPSCAAIPAGDDLPGWMVERASTVDGVNFIMYRDPNGECYGSRGAALRKTGQLFISRTESQIIRLTEQNRLLQQELLARPIVLSRALWERIERSQRAPRVFAPGEFERIINDRFTPTAIARMNAAVDAEGRVGRRVVVLDLFCGCGGLSLGVQATGFPHVMGIDENAASISSYRENRCGARSLEQRLRAGDALCWREALQTARLVGQDAASELVIIASPPCQPYSKHGSHASGPADDRDGLPILVEMILAMRPLIVLVENVVTMIKGEFEQHVKTTLSALAQAGYSIDATDHACADHGVPQMRKRTILAIVRRSTADGSFAVPPNITYKVGCSLGERSSLVRPIDAIDEPGFWTGKCPADLVIDLPTLKSRTRLASNAHLTATVHPFMLAPTLITSSLRSNTYNRLIAAPIEESQRRGLIHADMRMLHNRHGLLLQTFPPGFKLYGNLHLQALQVGNAVPPMFAYDMGVGLTSFLSQCFAASSETALGPKMRYHAMDIAKCIPTLKRAIAPLVAA